MTKRKWNQVDTIARRIIDLRESLHRDDPAREYLYRAEIALNDLLCFTVPEQ